MKIVVTFLLVWLVWADPAIAESSKPVQVAEKAATVLFLPPLAIAALFDGISWGLGYGLHKINPLDTEYPSFRAHRIVIEPVEKLLQ